MFIGMWFDIKMLVFAMQVYGCCIPVDKYVCHLNNFRVGFSSKHVENVY